ncbi:MAG: response regulator transcription factor [Planctomycetaceae bacterium]
MVQRNDFVPRSTAATAPVRRPEQVRVLCVDDHPFLYEGLRARLSLERDMLCVGHLASAHNLLAEVRRLEPGVILLDIEMPGPDPFEALGDLQRRHPGVRSIILSAYVRDHYVEAAISAGAWGYLSKGESPDAIVEAIRKVGEGEFALGAEVKERCRLRREGSGWRAERPSSKLGLLTPREQQILRFIGKGLSRADIAKTIFRSPKTVDAHRNSIMEKLGFNDRVDLVRYAIREGLVEP